MRRFPQLKAKITGITVDESACETDDLAYCGGVQVIAAADEDWDGLVRRAVESDWRGIEALSGLAGTVGDAVRSNFAAYGQAMADVVVSVRTWDHADGSQRTFPLSDCGFTTGASRFQERLEDGSLRYQVLDVSFLFKQGDITVPIRDEELAGLLGVETGARVPLGAVRDAVLETAVHARPAH